MELVKQIPTQHPWVHGAPGAVREGGWGGVHQKRKHPSTEVSWSPSGDSVSPASAEQLWRKCGSAGRSECLCVNHCAVDLFFFLLADSRGPPPSPSLRATAGRRVPVRDVPSFPRLPQRDAEPQGCSSGRGTERFGNGSLKGSVQGRGQCSSRRTTGL